MSETTWLGFAQIILPPAILVAVILFIIRVAINQMNQSINQLIQVINGRFDDANARTDDLQSAMTAMSNDLESKITANHEIWSRRLLQIMKI